jgi:hypothetical protein
MTIRDSSVIQAILLTEATYAVNHIVFNNELSDEVKEQQLSELFDNTDRVVLDINHVLEGSDKPQSRESFASLFFTAKEPKDILQRHYDTIASWDAKTLGVAKQMALSAIIFDTPETRKHGEMFLCMLVDVLTRSHRNTQ